MLKNQLYPFIEKYINEYLYGFTKEQLNVGVMNGIIALEGLNIRVDKVNEKLDNLEIPIWLKAGTIKKIRISCSLMNFIGEKPLDVNVEEIECLVCPSYKWIIKNLSTFIDENEYYIKEPYDATDNNSHDIFSRKINIYDSSVIKKEKLFEIFSDPSKMSQILNKIFTKCLKFYYQKAYLINLKIKKIHFRFEDDELLNLFSDIGFGVKINNIEISSIAEGTKKKNNIKCENLNVYWEPKPNILIPSKIIRESYKDNQIDEKYYEYLKTVDLKDNNFAHRCFIIENFNFMGNIGIQFIESGNIDLFSKREKNYRFLVQVATSELNINIYPEILKITQRIVDFIKSFYVIDPVQDFKPMRKPYNKFSELVKNLKNDSIFDYKRKRVVRDWIFYIIWFQRFKNAIYGKAFTNPLFSEFSKYFNICVVPNASINEAVGNGFPHINDSLYLKKNENSVIDQFGDKNNSNSTLIGNPKIEESINPENINLSISSEILIKSVNLHIHSKYHVKDKAHDYFLVKLTGLELKSLLLKEKFETSFDLKNIVINNKIQYEINKNLDSKINEEILNNNLNNNNINFDKCSVYTSGNYNNFTESEKLITKERISLTKTASLAGIPIVMKSSVNESFTSDVFYSPNRKNNEEMYFNIQQNVQTNTNSNINSYPAHKLENTKLNKRLNLIQHALETIKDKQSARGNSNRNETSFITFFLNDDQNGNIRDNVSISSGLNSIQNNPNVPYGQNQNESMNHNQNLSKMINEYNKNKIKQKNINTAVKIVPRSSYIRPVLAKNESCPVITHNNNASKNNLNISNVAVGKQIDSAKSMNENANVKVPINFIEFLPLNNLSHELSKNNVNGASSSLSLRFSKNVKDKKSNLSLNLNLGTCRINLLDKNLESSLHILFDYKSLNVFERKLEENGDSFMFKNKLFGIDLNYNRQIYEMKNFILNKLKNKIQIKDKDKEKDNSGADNLDYINYMKKDLENYDHNFLQNGNFELNYLFSSFLSANVEVNLNLNEFHIINLSYEDDSQKNITKYGKIKIPRNYIKFQFKEKNLLIRFFDFEIEFNESEKLRKALTEVSKILEDKLKSQLSSVNLLFKPVIKKIIEERKLAEKEIPSIKPKEIKKSNAEVSSNNQVQSQLSKKSSVKQIQTEYQKILSNNNLITNNNVILKKEKVKNPFEKESNVDNTFNQSHISFDEEFDVSKIKFANSKISITNKGDKAEENKKNFAKKIITGSNMKQAHSGNNMNNVRYEDSLSNPLNFSNDSEHFYNHIGSDKFSEILPAKTLTDDLGGDTSRTVPKEPPSAVEYKKNKQIEESNVYIGKYNK